MPNTQREACHSAVVQLLTAAYKNPHNTLTTIGNVTPIYVFLMCLCYTLSLNPAAHTLSGNQGEGGNDSCVSEERVKVVGSGGWEELTL